MADTPGEIGAAHRMGVPGLTHVEITSERPGMAILKVGGHELLASSAMLHLDTQSVPEIRVTLPVIDGVVVTLDARFGVDPESRDALVAAGWTPPPGDSGG